MLFLLYNAPLPSSAIVEHLFIVVETDWLTQSHQLEESGQLWFRHSAV